MKFKLYEKGSFQNLIEFYDNSRGSFT